MSTFGAITEKELDYILQHDGLIPLDLSDSVRKLPDLPETSIPEIEDANLFKKPTLPPMQQIQTETTGLLEGQGVDQSLLEIQENASEQLPEPPQEVALTPTKRTRSSPGIDGHKTPTKKRRELDTEPGSVLTPVPPRIEQPSDSFTLQSLITDGQEGKKTNQRSKRSKIIDEITQIPPPRLDIFIQSVRNDIIQLPKQTANKLLTTPSTNSRHWGKGLLDLYESMLLNPMSHSAVESIANPEVVLGPVSAIHTTTDVTADGLLIHGTLLENTSKTNGTKTFEQISIDQTIQMPPTESWPINVTNDFSQPLPETSVKEPHATSKMISDHPHSEIIKTVYGDWLENGEDGNFRVPLMDKGIERSPTVEVRVARYQSRSSKTSSASTILSTANLVKSNLLGYLHAFWSTNQVLTFKDLVPLSTSTKKDAIRMFSSLLELHKSKQVKLLQAEPYGHIYIQEYSMY
ncbi:uncharacterized protein LOC124176224 [Neodiprion fabricii]|uniref:uncharacterized protein LOC124176224 n=1 Tax=Neodiprion fabricii TaxID=2872261 RepID=UPI001ED93FAB|nr:uncharacterized protein LOC124176224 [Neodiprion fabricii]